MTNLKNSNYNKKIYKKKNVIAKYAKICREVNCEKYAYYNSENERKKLYCGQHKKENMVNKITKKIMNDNKCKYLDCKNLPIKIFVICIDINVYPVTQE